MSTNDENNYFQSFNSDGSVDSGFIVDRIDRNSVIAENFEFNNDSINIFLEDHDEFFKIVTRFSGGGLVNGFEYRIDNISNLDLSEILEIGIVKKFINRARADVENSEWINFENALKLES